MSMAETTFPSQETATSPTGGMEDLERLIIIEQVRRLKATYCRLLDQHLWPELAALFVPDAHFTLATTGEPLRFDGVETWLAYVRPLLDGSQTVHQVPQAEIDVEDSTNVRALWAMTDYVIPRPETGRAPFFGYGHYREHYRKEAGSWRIVSLELTRLILGSGAPPAAPPLG